MSSTTFVDYTTPVNAAWLNDVNSSTYGGTAGQVLTATGAGGAATWQSAGTSNTAKLSVYLTAAANNAGANSYTKCPLDTVQFDTQSIWDVTNKRAIPKLPGYYQVNLGCRFSASGILNVAIGLNGAQYLGVGVDTGGTILANHGSGMVFCNGTTDYIELWVYGNSGVRAYTGGRFDTYMQVVGPL